MSSANPDRLSIHVKVNPDTRAKLEAIARRHSSDFTSAVIDAINWLDFAETQAEQGAIVFMRIAGRDFFMMSPGTASGAAFDRAVLMAEYLRKTT